MAVVVAQAQQALLIGTHITDFRVSPTKVAVGETVTIAGTLQWHLFPCFWFALEGRTVKILADTTKLGEAKSGGGGGFRFVWTPMYKGAYWIKARFPGDLLYNGCSSATIKVDVMSREEKEEEERRFWALVGVGAVVTLAVVGGVVYTFEEERRFRMLMLRRR